MAKVSTDTPTVNTPQVPLRIYDALSFKNYFNDALVATVENVEQNILTDNRSSIDQSKFLSGQLIAVRSLHSSMEHYFQECLDQSRVAVTPNVLATFLIKRVMEIRSGHKEALLNASYESTNQRSHMQGVYTGFSEIIRSLTDLHAAFEKLCNPTPQAPDAPDEAEPDAVCTKEPCMTEDEA